MLELLLENTFVWENLWNEKRIIFVRVARHSLIALSRARTGCEVKWFFISHVHCDLLAFLSLMESNFHSSYLIISENERYLILNLIEKTIESFYTHLMFFSFLKFRFDIAELFLENLVDRKREMNFLVKTSHCFYSISLTKSGIFVVESLKQELFSYHWCFSSIYWLHSRLHIFWNSFQDNWTKFQCLRNY